MSITVNDPTLLSQLTAVAGPVELNAPDGRSLGILTPQKAEDILAAAKAVGENPLFEEYVKSIEEYRRLNNTVPDSD
jgi:hypothetical protein